MARFVIVVILLFCMGGAPNVAIAAAKKGTAAGQPTAAKPEQPGAAKPEQPADGKKAAEEPAPKYPAGVESLIASINSLTATADLAEGRALSRANIIRAALTKQIIDMNGVGVTGSPAGKAEAKGNTQLPIEVPGLLCEVYAKQVAVAVSQNYLSAVSQEVQKAATGEKIDTIISALTVLFKDRSQEISVKAENAQKAQDAAFNFCVADLGRYPTEYYGQLAPADAGLLLLLGPITALFKSVVDIIFPPLQAGAKLLDEQARNAAIRKFLQSPSVRAQIQNSAITLNAAVTGTIQRRRLQLVGQFVEQITSIRRTSQDLGKFNCEAGLENGAVKLTVTTIEKHKVTLPSEEFILCYKKAWAGLSEAVGSALKIADEYDKLAAAPGDLKGEKVQLITKQLDKISKQSLSALELKQLWEAAVEIVAFAQSVVAAASPENKEKIGKQIDAIVKAAKE